MPFPLATAASGEQSAVIPTAFPSGQGPLRLGFLDLQFPELRPGGTVARVSLSFSSFRSSQFLDSVCSSLLPDLQKFQPLFLQIFLQPHSLFPLIPGPGWQGMLDLLVQSHRKHWLLLLLFFNVYFLLFRLGHFYCPVFRFTGSLLCPLHLPVEPIQRVFFIFYFWLLHFSVLKSPFAFSLCLLFSLLRVPFVV